MVNKTLKSIIRDVHNFPKPGIVFKDITPIFLNPEVSTQVVDHLYNLHKDKNIEVIAGIESRGFLFGFPLALKLGVPFVLIRKEGKLPYDKVSYNYDLEYGVSTIEMHTDAIKPKQRILIHDDLLATGGSAEAAARLIEKQNGEIIGFNFLIELDFLNGRKRLSTISENIESIVKY